MGRAEGCESLGTEVKPVILEHPDSWSRTGSAGPDLVPVGWSGISTGWTQRFLRSLGGSVKMGGLAVESWNFGNLVHWSFDEFSLFLWVPILVCFQKDYNLPEWMTFNL